MENPIEMLKNDKFALNNDMEITEVKPGYAVTRMKVSEKHLNGLGMVQGGAIFTLADYAFAAASNSKGLVTVGVNVNITYFKTPKGKVLTAEAREVSSGRKLCSYNVDIFDENKELIARFTSVGYIKG